VGDIVKFGRVRFRVKELVVKETVELPSDEEQPEYVVKNHELEPSGVRETCANLDRYLTQQEDRAGDADFMGEGALNLEETIPKPTTDDPTPSISSS
jgi:hypothetical protein